MLFRIALLHGHSPWVLHWWRACPQSLGPPGFQIGQCGLRPWNAGAGKNGWADGLTAGALRAGLEPPTKTSGEICWLEQCRPDAESSGPFSSGVGQRCRGGPQSNGEHALHQQGLPPGGGLRRWPRLSAVLGRPHDGSGKRQHDGGHQPARTWGEVRRWWCQVRTSALVTLGVGWGLLRTGYRLRPGAVAVVGSAARGGRRGARPKYLSGPVRAWAPGLTWRRLSRRTARSCSWMRTLRGVPKTGPRARDGAGSTLRSSGRAIPGGRSRRSGDWRPTMTGPPGKAVAPPGSAGGKGDN